MGGVERQVCWDLPPITLTLVSRGRMLRGEVTDHGRAWPRPMTPGDDDEGGRGLAIVAVLATRWGVDPAERGKTTWFCCQSSEA